MTTEALATPVEDLDPADPERAALDRRLAMLDTLAEKAAKIADVIEGQVVAMKRLPGEIVRQEEVDAAQVLSLAFERACRAVGMCFMLQDRLKKEYKQRASAAASQARSDAIFAKFDRANLAKAHKARAVAVVKEVATTQGVEPYQIERLLKEARGYLDQDHIIGDVLNRPISELITMICDMAGLSPDWKKLAEEAWAQAEIATGKPFPSPFRGEGCRDGGATAHGPGPVPPDDPVEHPLSSQDLEPDSS